MSMSEISLSSPKKIKAADVEVTLCESILPPICNHFVADESENDTSAQSGATLWLSGEWLLEKPEVETFMRIMDNAHQDISEFFVHKHKNQCMATNSQVRADLIKTWWIIEPHFASAERLGPPLRD